MGSLNARRQVIEELLLPEVGIFPHGLLDIPELVGRSAGPPRRFTIGVFALISRLACSLMKPAGQMLSL
jgi:hypothetical protein